MVDFQGPRLFPSLTRISDASDRSQASNDTESYDPFPLIILFSVDLQVSINFSANSYIAVAVK